MRKVHSPSFRDRLPAAGAILAIAIAVITAAGWIFHLPRLLQIWPGAPSIAVDTDILFFLSGLGLLILQTRKSRLSIALGAVILVFAAVGCAIGQQPGVFFSIHRFFPQWTITVLSLPDPAIMTMVQPVAIIFILSGCALVLSSIARQNGSSRVLWGVVVCGAALASIGFFAVVTLAAKLNTYPGQKHFLAQMSLWTAVGAIVLGVSFCSFFAVQYQPARHHLAIGLAIVALIALFFLRSGVEYALLLNTDTMVASRISLAKAHAATTLVQSLVSEVQKAESGQRGFLLTSDPAYLDAYEQGLNSIHENLAEFNRTLDPSPDSRDFTRSIDLKLAELAQTVSLEKRGDQAQALQFVRSNLGLRLSRDIQSSAQKLIASLRADIQLYSSANWYSVGAMKRSVLASLAISVLVIGAAIGLILAEMKRWTSEQQRLQENEASLEQRVVERTEELTNEIKKRRLSEQKSKETQEILDAALNYSTVAAWVWNPGADITSWRGPVSKIFGREPNEIDSRTKFQEILHPDDRERFNRLLIDTMLTGAEYDGEFRILLPSGEVRWIAGRGGAFFAGDRLLRMTGVSFDITEKKLAELQFQSTAGALRQRDEKLAFIFENAAIGDWSWNMADDRVEAHPVVWKLYGSDECHHSEPAAWFSERQHPEDRAMIQEHNAAALAGNGVIDIDFRVVWPDKSIHWIACRGSVVFDANGIAIATHGVNFDITDRKRMEMNLKESEAQFRHLADAMPQIVWQAGADGLVDAYNEQWYKLTGLPRNSTTPDRDWVFAVHPADLDACAKQWAASIQSGTPFEMELRLWAPERQTHRWYLARALPVRNQAGEIVRWFGTTTDIHDQKTAKDLLEGEVQSRTESLREALAEKNTLLREVHHRVKNDLQIVSSLLRMQSELVPEPAARTALEESRQRLFAMTLIHERLFCGNQMNGIEFQDYARALIDELSYAYSPSGDIRVSLDGAAITLDIDQAIPCSLILNELLTNALKYAYPNGAGEILVKLVEDDQSRITLSVSDQGVGLPSGFDPSQCKSMGMSIIDVLTRQLNGRLFVERQEGAKFSITFPREPKQAANASAA